MPEKEKQQEDEKDIQQNVAEETTSAEQKTTEAESPAPEAEESVPGPSEEEAKAKEALEELNNRYLRLLADFDNFKRRTANEKSDIYKYGNMNLLKELLPVLDSFELALKAVPNDGPDNIQAFGEGFAKVCKQLTDALAKDGLERIDAMGKVYDPVYHEAIMVVEDADADPNTVIDELRTGYMYKDKVLRPTVCRVSSATSKKTSENQDH